MKKKALSIAMISLMAISLAACSGGGSTNASGSSADTSSSAEKPASEAEASAEESGETESGASEGSGKVFKIGVLQLTRHDALDKANKGFFDALDAAGIQYEADQQNAGGEQSTCQTIAEKLVNDKDDLIFAIATPAAQAAAGATSEIPVIVTAVTDPVSAGLVESNEAPGGNVTGTSDLTPVKEQIELLKQILPDAKNVGVIYCSAEANSEFQANMAHEACEELGLSYKDYTVSSSNEIQTVVESMIGKVDAIYTPTDNMISAGMSTVTMIATENKIPVICAESAMVEQGGLATYGIDYYELGYLAGEQAVRILRDGASPADMPVEYLPAEKCEFMVNEEAAAALGIDVSSVNLMPAAAQNK